MNKRHEGYTNALNGWCSRGLPASCPVGQAKNKQKGHRAGSGHLTQDWTCMGNGRLDARCFVARPVLHILDESETASHS